MLEQLRRNSRSFIIWILFGIIIAVFIISFGPQANPESLGCGHSSRVRARGGRRGRLDEQLAFRRQRGELAAAHPRRPQDAAYRRQLAVDLLVAARAPGPGGRGARLPGVRTIWSTRRSRPASSTSSATRSGSTTRASSATTSSSRRSPAASGCRNVAQLIEEQRREQLAEMTRHLFLASARGLRRGSRSRRTSRTTPGSPPTTSSSTSAATRARSRSAEEDIARYAARARGGSQEGLGDGEGPVDERPSRACWRATSSSPRKRAKPAPDEQARGEAGRTRAEAKEPGETKEGEAAAAAKKAEEAKAAAAQAPTRPRRCTRG